MPKFVFRAKSFNGKLVSGEIEAASVEEARVKLRTQRLVPTKILEKQKRVLAQAKGPAVIFLPQK
jgi:type II secretory pathway component PulF